MRRLWSSLSSLILYVLLLLPFRFAFLPPLPRHVNQKDRQHNHHERSILPTASPSAHGLSTPHGTCSEQKFVACIWNRQHRNSRSSFFSFRDANTGYEDFRGQEEDQFVAPSSSFALSHISENYVHDDGDSDNDDYVRRFPSTDNSSTLTLLLRDHESDFNATSTVPPITFSSSSNHNLSYFYLKHELGLSEAALWRITYDAGSALGMTAATIRKKVQVLRENLNLNPHEVCQLLERHPAILHLSADKNLAPTILFLVRALDLGKDELRAIVLASPSVLSYRKDNLKAKINFFTQIMGYSVEECRKLFVSEPRLLRASVSSNLVPTMRFFVREIEIPLVKLRQMLQVNPRIFLYSLNLKLIPTVIFYFIMNLQMNLGQVQKILLSYPMILDCNLERRILPVTRYFLTDLEYGPTELVSILLKFPRLFTYSLSRKIKHVVGYLRFEVGLNGSQVKRVLYQAPQVMGLSSTTLERNVQFLQTSLQLSSQEELAKVVSGMPSLLVLSSKTNLQPKLDYLHHSLGGSADLVRETVLRLPTLLGYSLDLRLKPRMERILKAGLDPGSITVGMPMKEESFMGWLQRKEQKMNKQKRLSAIVPSFTYNNSISNMNNYYYNSQAKAQAHRTIQLQNPESKNSNVVNNVEEGPSRIVHWTRERRPILEKSG